MNTPPETTQITATVTLDIHPKPGQSTAEAAEHFHQMFREYLEHKDFPFWEDYGAEIDDIREARQNGETPTWGGYEGPYVTRVSVRDEDAVHARAEALTNLAGRDPNDPAAWEEALKQAQREWEDDRARRSPDRV